MPYEIATAPIQEEIILLLESDTALTSLLATRPVGRGGGPAIYEDGDVPDGQLFPFVTIGAWTQIPFHRFSPNGDGYGWNCTGQLKVVSQRISQPEDVLSAALAVIPQGQTIDVTGYGSGWFDEPNVQPKLKVILAGKVTYELSAILRVYVCD